MRHSTFFVKSLLACSVIALAACGGGGGGGSSAPVVVTPPPPPVSTAPTWTQGQFANKSTYAAQCVTVRSGISPVTNQPYPDVAGSEALEKFWVRSFNNETYLWYDEVTDIDPNGVSGVVPYFNTQKTSATTASGKPKDEFHFTEPTEEYEQGFSSGARIWYAMDARIVGPDNETRVLYTEPGSAVSQAPINLKRGDRILGVDGVTLSNLANQGEVDTANAGLFPRTAGETHTLTIQDAGTTNTRDVTVTSGVFDQASVNSFKTIDTASGKVGYMLFNTFSPRAGEQELINAFNSLSASGVNDFVLDLRYNGGGLVGIASELSFMIAGSANTSGKVFTNYRQNNKQASTSPVPFVDEAIGYSAPEGTPLPSLNLPRVFVLTTARSCSASELVINALNGADVEIIMVGDRTCGKPFGFSPEDNCGTTFYTVQFQTENNKGFGDYADGFIPANGNVDGAGGVTVAGCAVRDDYLNQLGDPDENLLEAALAYRASGTCPAGLLTKTSPEAAAKPFSNIREIGQSERILGQDRINNALIRDERLRTIK